MARRPVALTIAGSDSGGGAGIQADLKTFSALGAHGTSVLTCLTAQNPKAVRAVHPVTPRFLREQLEAVFSELPPAAVKTGMLYSASILREVVAWRRSHPAQPWIVDPVMLATRGASLLEPAARRLLRDRLLPLATLITPNLDEAAVLLGESVRSLGEMASAARRLHEALGCAVLVKGGHVRNSERAVDILIVDGRERRLSAPRVRGVSTHGTGCTFSAAITARLALGDTLTSAVIAAKRFMTQAIRGSVRVGRHRALNWEWEHGQ
ncbi:MAG: bifunctional hydroxymethylpyrimidine kinase/phosphomethylpyrimidine kinase [Verrucomicrobia bacterium]|nr:bifunctional hydroxymethylpyrimidine kinase/phosphomethylpyrimidine kinase [Verrucomicrobiota bacterium]MBI3868926.1 bifunctional hydroxymethylpyrimidine kinase/phosphomethylpyrimidine kinase [Verrucomicrobiota bacterium]